MANLDDRTIKLIVAPGMSTLAKLCHINVSNVANAAFISLEFPFLVGSGDVITFSSSPSSHLRWPVVNASAAQYPNANI
eukprot:CAMPEP_0204627948 /NCGR_PEP_ID=MMETSP0717-20131115/14593_1 /ASSEMBLY_ACC=CAM_ASM_000666 /TAXON_ID=230516 /ORGANISM="Chaetoceros curvisetus" /LENGTH=78 /DNA_ID=CAMNT_0051644363 /DNA_START=157 /DNA_END=393 /DNA_ORIENTATION=+